MPRVIALGKLQKKLRKRKGENLDALGDRDKKRLTTAALREQKLKSMGAVRAKGREKEMIRCGYFKVATKDSTAALGVDEIRELIEKWVHRHDSELAELEAQRRPGRPPTAKETLLRQKVASEVDEFRTGYYMPDLQDWENIEHLQRWDGTVGSLSQVKFTRISREGALPKPEDKMEM